MRLPLANNTRHNKHLPSMRNEDRRYVYYVPWMVVFDSIEEREIFKFIHGSCAIFSTKFASQYAITKIC